MTEFTSITPRVQTLLENLKDRASKDRSSEWFCEDDFKKSRKDVFKQHNLANDEDYFKLSVIERKAIAIDIMLRSMTDSKVSKHTHTYEIEDGELIVGVMPMASISRTKNPRNPQMMPADKAAAIPICLSNPVTVIVSF